MAEKKERNALDYNYILKVLEEHGTPEQRKAFCKAAYGYCKTITVIAEKGKHKGEEVRSFAWVKDTEEIARMKAQGKQKSYNKRAGEEWFKKNMPEFVPQPKEKLNTRSMLEMWGEEE